MTKTAQRGVPAAGNPRGGFGGVIAASARRGALAIAVAWGAASAPGMTQSELQALISDAQEGATVVVTSDVTLSGPLQIVRKVTLTSPEGVTNVFTRSANVTMVNMGHEDADLRVENLVFDGASAYNFNNRFAECNQGRITLGPGAAIRNFNIGSLAGTVYLSGGSARLVMEEGSEIRNCRSENYAPAVLVHGSDTVFDMLGGVIAECVGLWAKDDPTYDGTVYVYGGTFNMYGGTIAGNTSLNCTAGVVLYGGTFTMFGGVITGNSGGHAGGFYGYSGTFNLGGNACLTNNVGGIVNDMFLNEDTNRFSHAMGYIHRGFCGQATIHVTYTPTTNTDWNWPRNFRTVPAEDITGAGRITCQEHPEFCFDGTRNNDEWLYWISSDYKVDGEGVPNFSRMEALLTNTAHTVELCKDLMWDGLWEIPAKLRRLTFKSPDGTNHFLQAISAKFPQVLSMKSTNTTVRLENITLRGIPAGEVVCLCAGRLELGPGAVLERGKRGVDMPTGSAATLVMEDGAEIRNCFLPDSDAYGSAVKLGVYNAFGARFEMKGGVISNCVCATDAIYPSSTGYGGAVYTYGGDFVMTGGRITGNICTNSAAGVVHYRGTATFGGDAVVEGNEGEGPDLYVCGGTTATFAGDFRGRVGVSNESQEPGGTFRVMPQEGATGAWRFFAAGRGAAKGLIGSWGGEGAQLRWGVPSGWIGDTAFASVEDASQALPKTLSALSEDREKLPLVFRGTAAGVSGEVALTCSAAELREAGALPLVVFRCEDGRFTGKVTFTLSDDDGGRLVCHRRGSAYVLGERTGAMIIVK